MFFSIVIPTYNRQKLLSSSITSVLDQTFTDYELIIVDDGSTDNTEAFIKTFTNPKIHYIKTENFGVAHARNVGIKSALGNYISFLDSDDFLQTDHLQVAFDEVEKNNQPEVIHLNFSWGLEDGSSAQKNNLPKKLPEDIFKSCSLHVNCVFIRKDVALINLFNENRELMFAEDWDFFIKLSVHHNIIFKDQTTAYLVNHEDRSMRNFNELVWAKRRDQLIKSLKNDKIINAKYPHKLKQVSAHMNSLIALNLAINGSKKSCLNYLKIVFKEHKAELFTKRFLATIKYLLFTW
jgi:glycosyltransferase involved in cell wall biosynthesis